MAHQKTALVTGANKGIGFETVRQLALKGYTVWLGARDEKRGVEAADLLQKEKLDVRFVSLDVTNDANIKAAAKTVEAKSGSLDILVNNAGVYLMGKDGPASSIAIDVMKETYETNVYGPLRVTQAFLPLLKKSQNASVVMVSSGLGSVKLIADQTPGLAEVQMIAYNSSKSALNAITVGLANEFRMAGIKFNAINPGYIGTDLNGHSGPGQPIDATHVILRMAIADAKSPTGTFASEDTTMPW